MTLLHWHVLLVYLGFTLAATLLAFARRLLRPDFAGESVWRKYPAYILINLIFVMAGWLPRERNVLTALLAMLGGLASWEIVRAMWPESQSPLSNERARLPPLSLSGRRVGGLGRILPLLTAGLVAASGWVEQRMFVSLWLGVMLALIAASALTGQREDLGRQMMVLGGSLVYLPFCLAAYLWVWREDSAGFRVTFLYLTAATNDALAQITGQLFGRRPLARLISPAKTMEGALGGVLFAGAMGAALSPTVEWGYPVGTGIGLLTGLAGMVGDLSESAWKRALGLRNFSGLLGAQGGVLDRFDGLIFAAPVFYLLTSWK